MVDEKDGGEDQAAELTLLLNRMQKGDRDAAERAVEMVYSELHRIAARAMGREGPGHVLQTTALIHEAYASLTNLAAVEVQNRHHFFAIASKQMRRILVDHARARDAQKRGGALQPVDLENAQLALDPPNVNVLALDEAMGKLEEVDPRASRVVEMRFFGGYTDQEIAEVLQTSHSTIRRDWEFARAWLYSRMRGQDRATAAPS